MNRRWILGIALGLVVAVVVAWRRRRTSREDARWRTVTVLKSRAEVMPGGRLPEPLADLPEEVDVRLADAPGGRGTELSARLVKGDPVGYAVISRIRGTDPRQQLRTALRESKTLLEVGELTRQHPMAHGRRRSTVLGRLTELVAARGAGEGVL